VTKPAESAGFFYVRRWRNGLIERAYRMAAACKAALR